MKGNAQTIGFPWPLPEGPLEQDEVHQGAHVGMRSLMGLCFRV